MTWMCALYCVLAAAIAVQQFLIASMTRRVKWLEEIVVGRLVKLAAKEPHERFR